MQRVPWWQFWRRTEPLANPELVRHLAATLGLPPMRQSIRLPVQASMEVVVGLSQIHRALADDYGIDSLSPQAADPRFVGRDVRNDLHNGDGDIWSLIYPVDLLRRMATPAKAGNTISARERAGHGQNWTLLNTSAGGYCLQSDPTQPCKAQVNDLVAIRERGDKRYSWQLGVIRWMQQLPDGLQAGIQILGAEPVPILASGLQHAKRTGSPARSLLLPADKATGRPATLLTTPLPQELPQQMLLTGPAGEHEVFLIRLLESCDGFVQFEYRAARAAAIDSAPRRPVSVT
jgi:hypothetical protein